jgi:hypothetical protein
MSPQGQKSKKKKRKGKQLPKTYKSILDRDDTSCLAVVNFFRDGQQTQVLWIATTPFEPPIQSIHYKWRQIGLATYLLAILVKQHTGIGDGNLNDSIICLQASSDRTDPVRSFYLKVGFTSYDLDDNGLSETSPAFQSAVHRIPEAWVFVLKQKMSLFKLYRGSLKVSPAVTVDLTNDVSSPKCTWKTYGYSRFPYKAKSMKTIESFLHSYPILSCLSLGALPLTDRPFLMPERSPSSLFGLILGQSRLSMNESSWLRTDELYFLLAFLNRSQEKQDKCYFHFLGPAITDTLSVLYATFDKVKSGVASDDEKCAHSTNFHAVIKYIDSNSGIMDRKFLIFICNRSTSHWIAVIVINPWVISDPFINKGKGNVSDFDEVSGWLVLDSNHSHYKEKTQDGFQSSLHTKGCASAGVRLFLNICASYQKYECDKLEGNAGDSTLLPYKEPFGEYCVDDDEMNDFPRMYYPFPSIIQQQNSNDCGLCVIANSMAFVLHLREIPFIEGNVTWNTKQGAGYLMSNSNFNLRPF